MKPSLIWAVLRETIVESMADRVPRLGAAIAFYMTFSLAPLLLLVVAIAGFVYGQQAAEGQLFRNMESVVGHDIAQTIQSLVMAADRQGGVLASSVAAITALIGVLGVFGELQDASNHVLGIEQPWTGIWALVQRRFLAFLLVIAFGCLLVTSLALSTTMTVMNGILAKRAYSIQVPTVLTTFFPHIVSFVIVTVIFAMTYRFLPDVRVAWRSVWVGSLAGSSLFAVGKTLLSQYLAHVAATSVYGAAASLAVLMLWNYYTAQIILIGAELMKVHARYTSRQGK